MGKVIITVQSPQMLTPALFAAVQKFFPTEEQFGQCLLIGYGFKPAEIEICIVPNEEEENNAIIST